MHQKCRLNSVNSETTGDELVITSSRLLLVIGLHIQTKIAGSFEQPNVTVERMFTSKECLASVTLRFRLGAITRGLKQKMEGNGRTCILCSLIEC